MREAFVDTLGIASDLPPLLEADYEKGRMNVSGALIRGQVLV